jgi:hypothetical protein
MVRWSHRPGVPYYPPSRKIDPMTDEQIKHMANRFLGWRLPDDFNPDDGISFDPVSNKGSKYEARRQPTGTNLFTATQAEAMVRYMLDSVEPILSPAPDDVPAVNPMENAMVRSPHIVRMEDELAQLRDRAEKLTAFIAGNPVFAAMPSIDQALMAQQLGAMRQYEAILSLRLTRAEAA